MKIALITQNLGSGGAEKMMAFVIKTLAPISDEVIVVMAEDNCKYEFPPNVRIVVLEGKKQSNSFFGKIKSVVHLSHEAKRIIIQNQSDILIGFGAYFTTVSVLAAINTKCKVLGSERRAPSLMSLRWKLISRWAYHKCDKVVFQLQGARDFYQRIPNKKVCIIPNAFISTWDYLPHIIERRKVICMAAARLEYEKGFDIGIKAMSIVIRKHPEYKMEIFGAGDFKKMYGELIERLNLSDYIEYKGLSKEIINEIYDSSVFILPSRSEGIPNMLLEAMAAGLPCVASNCPPGGPQMLINDGENGLIVSVERHDILADAICRIIDDNNLSIRLSSNARKVKERFSPSVIGDKWIQCIQSLVDN